MRVLVISGGTDCLEIQNARPERQGPDSLRLAPSGAFGRASVHHVIDGSSVFHVMETAPSVVKDVFDLSIGGPINAELVGCECLPGGGAVNTAAGDGVVG